MQVLVRDNNVDQALKALKKKMQREGIFREMKLRGHYEKPSEKKARERAEAIRRARKLARKKMQREGLLPMKPKIVPGAGPARGAPGGRAFNLRAFSGRPAAAAPKRRHATRALRPALFFLQFDFHSNLSAKNVFTASIAPKLPRLPWPPPAMRTKRFGDLARS